MAMPFPSNGPLGARAGAIWRGSQQRQQGNLRCGLSSSPSTARSERNKGEAAAGWYRGEGEEMQVQAALKHDTEPIHHKLTTNQTTLPASSVHHPGPALVLPEPCGLNLTSCSSIFALYAR